MKRKQKDEPTSEELALEEMIFGSSSGSKSPKQGAGSSAADAEVGAIGFKLDRKGTRDESGSKIGVTAAWQDDDDADLQVDIMATDRLKKLNKSEATNSKKQKSKKLVGGTELTSLLQERFQTNQLEWAKIEAEDQEDPALAILRQEGSMVESLGNKGKRKGSGKANIGALPAGKLNILRLVDANVADPSKERITSVMFHASGSLLLTGGHDRHLRFFRIDGKTNDRVLSCKFGDMVISNAAFLGASAEVVVGGRKPFFYGYDTESGHVSRYPGLMGKGLRSHENMLVSPMGSKLAFLGASGYVHVACGKQKTWIMDLKMNSGARAGAFITEDTMVTSGVDADVYLWDLRMQGRCVSRFKHEDGTVTSALAALPASSAAPQYMAVGAESGAVTLFAGSGNTAITAPPSKSFLHLTTQITSLAFHPSAEILAMASNHKTDHLRMLHVPSGTIFSNWPTANTPLRKVQCMAFSPSGTHLACGNDKGKVLLYRLNHYN